MINELMIMLRVIAALVAGGIIGTAFGWMQEAARRRNERLQQTGKLKSAWMVMPGSGARVFYLLIVLVLVQVFCPLLFAKNAKWWVFAGIALGYGARLFQQMRQRQSHKL